MAEQQKQQQKDPMLEIVKAMGNPNVKDKLVKVLPQEMDVDRVLVICQQAVQRNATLKKCLPISIVSSVIEASQLGLELDPLLGHGYLIPRKNNKLSEKWQRDIYLCSFMPGYRGFVHLMRNSGIVYGVNAELVLNGEQFRVELGTERRIIHNPDYTLTARFRMKTAKDGEVYDDSTWLGAYCTIKAKDGWEDFEYLPAGNIHDRRARSESPNSGPWVTDKPEMWKKCPVRAIAKRMPLSPQNRVLQALAKAATLDEYRESPEYREHETAAPVLELKSEEEFIDTEHEAGEQITGTDEVEKKESAKPEEPKKEPIRRKSDDKKKKEEEKASAETPKEQPAPKPADGPELITAGAASNLRRFAFDEKGMTEAELIQVCGNFGYEKVEQIPKKEYAKVWSEVGNRSPKKKS